MAHAEGIPGIKAAVRAGVDSIEHGTMLDEEGAAMMEQRGTWLVPTLETFQREVPPSSGIEPAMVEPTFAAVPPDWTVKEASSGDVAPNETGWAVTRIPPGFVKIMEGFRKLRGRRDPVAHLVFSDGLVAISVFVEPFTTAQVPAGMTHQGGLNVYTVRQDDHLVTVLGEAPGAAVRLIGNSVSHR